MRLLGFLALLALAAGGCCPPGGNLLGKEFGAAPVVAVRDARAARAPVTLRGTMTEKCPVAACWFRLKDRTGVMKVDLKAAGFTVTDVPEGAEVTVSGIIDRREDPPSLVATGLRW